MDVTMESAPADKIRLFRAMFRGREDVYARRYVSAKSGKSGCSPVCAIEWTHFVDNETNHLKRGVSLGAEYSTIRGKKWTCSL